MQIEARNRVYYCGTTSLPVRKVEGIPLRDLGIHHREVYQDI